MTSRTHLPTRLRQLAALGVLSLPLLAQAWGDDGHQLVARLAAEHLSTQEMQKLQAWLQADQEVLPRRDGRTSAADLGTQASWADDYRESQGKEGRPYKLSATWHYVNRPIDSVQPPEECRPDKVGPVQDTPASERGEGACVMVKIAQLQQDLAKPGYLDAPGRARAVKFLMHLIGDLHQPLHASDDHDKGGNAKTVVWPPRAPGSLHHHWDSVWLQTIAKGPQASRLTEQMDWIRSRYPAQVRATWGGSLNPFEWAEDSFLLSKNVAYGMLPPAENGRHALTQGYVDEASEATRLQLARAGWRLALTLKAALASAEGPQP